MRAGLYVRISRDREGLEAGVDRQEADCRKLAQSRGWQLTEVYSDNDTSATDRRKVRKAYRRMLDDLREERLDAIVAYSSSRLYRRARDLEELVALVEARHAEIATVASGRIDLSTADGRMMARILASVDQAEAERIAERSGRAKAALKEQGRWLGGGVRAFGYERVKDARGKVTHRIKRDEAAVLGRLARRALAGDSLTSLARDLNERGITTATGKRWQPSRVRRVLTTSFSAGLHADGTSGDWPAILTPDQHLLLVARFPAPKGVGRGRGGRMDRRYMLSGLLVCSECGKKMLHSGSSYRCQLRNGGCGRVQIKDRVIESIVKDAVWNRQSIWEAIAAEEGVTTPTDDTPDVLVEELHAIEARRLALSDDYAAGNIALEDFRRTSEALSRRTAEVESRIRETAPVKVPDFAVLMSEPTDLEWNDFMSQVIDRITVTPARGRGRSRLADQLPRIRVSWVA
jgi:DNA invertase Pin-like site-specific DNA recombinase